MKAKETLADYPHRRKNILTGEWVLVSPHRTKRPWQGQMEKHSGGEKPLYDPDCYLCPRNIRAGGAINPDYKDVFVFTNDYSALLDDVPDNQINLDNLFIAENEKGICRVICFSPRHDLTLPLMEIAEIKKVVDLWENEYRTLGNLNDINYVQIFENKGSVMGCSNPHPHGQIWAQKSIPVEPAKELANFTKYYEETHNCLLCDYLKAELSFKERIVYENDHFVTLVPFWATWPYETIIISKKHLRNLSEFSEDERYSFADILQKTTIKYDNLFLTSFPYSAGLHQNPTDGKDYDEWHFHMHFYPPLLRSATVKKFMVGYEMLANAQRDITPEQAADVLAGLSIKHYSK